MNITAAVSHLSNRWLPSIDVWSYEIMALWVPIAVYWVQCTVFELLMRAEIPFFEKYRIHTSEERTKRNKVSFTRVLVMVAFQQTIQMMLGYMLMKPVDPKIKAYEDQVALNHLTGQMLSIITYFTNSPYAVQWASSLAWLTQWVAIPALKFLAGMVIMDTHQYILHRMAHQYTFLYKNFHSHHHRLYVPYAFGALYNHPVEGFCLDTVGGALSFELTRMSPFLGMCFFTFSNLKTINDHCGYAFPWDPLNVCFGNNVVYHDIHHQPYGIKKNFSQPFFTFWDKLLGSHYDGPHKVTKSN
ncbi:uncharacterized protein BYT42DRAFT_583666 [Radiomyces spectabilis]|uniref:uncharacterized protein n=1 Tax=Radiomyces spectabilis TaxID=64574 RepID=UPI00221EB5B2|nr:uncharacterized protein BYT42DRAFT_583666 [Radiomyces spectabilis]KAI8369254.1 hypothetical protein BYT42DRAFT_583666 [Radiomyces spectabilis]